MKNYRIKRTSRRNVTIQRRNPKGNWITQSYHGNSTQSLVSGLLELAMKKHTPEGAKLCEQLEKLELELVSMRGELVKLIEDWKNEGKG